MHPVPTLQERDFLAHAAGLAGPADVVGGNALASGADGLITRDVALRTGAPTVLLAVRRDAELLVDIVSEWGLASANGGRGQLFSFANLVLNSGRSAICEIDGAPGAPLTCAAGAPVLAPGSPPGVLCAAFREAPNAPEVLLWTLERYAALASLLQHDPGALDGTLEASRFDGLTGLRNYGAICAELHREIERTKRTGRPLSCCFLDLDRFKQVNEVHGHLRGNVVLAEVAAILQDRLRAGDTLGRYGGDEFVVILPDTEYAAASILAQRLRSIVPSAHDGLTSLDASVGLAQWQTGMTVADLLAAADEALRAAKRAGGGLVLGAGGRRGQGGPRRP